MSIAVFSMLLILMYMVAGSFRPVVVCGAVGFITGVILQSLIH